MFILGIDLSDPAILESWSQVTGPESENWVLLHLPTTNVASFYKKGTTVEELLSVGFDDDNVYFGAVRVTIESQTKYFKFSFIGTNVSGMKKAKVSIYISANLKYHY